jgi:hypothetical protein
MSESVVNFRREPKFIRERFDDIARRGSEYLVKNLLPAQGFGYVAGPSGSYKTFLVLDWCMALAQGRSILDHRSRPCGVVYVAAEAPNGVRKRVEAWRLRNPGEGLPFELIAQAPDLREPKQIEDLAAELRIAADEMGARGHRLGLVVIDTLAASMPGGDENAGMDVSAVLSSIAWLGVELSAFILIVSHTGKDQTRGLRGWSGQFAGADCVIMLTRDEESGLRTGKVTKLKDGEDGQRFALRLERVVLGEDEDGDEVSSAVVVYEDAPDVSMKPRKQRALNPGERIVLAAVAHVTDHGPTQSIPMTILGTKSWMKAVTRADVRARAMASGFADPDTKPDTVRQQFFRALQGIVGTGKVRVEGDLIWLLEGVTA